MRTLRERDVEHSLLGMGGTQRGKEHLLRSVLALDSGPDLGELALSTAVKSDVADSQDDITLLDVNGLGLASLHNQTYEDISGV